MTHPNAGGDWYKNKLRPLLGSEVVGIYQDEEGFLCIVCEKDDVTYHLWLFSDDEGNYPGSFDLIEQVEPDYT